MLNKYKKIVLIFLTVFVTVFSVASPAYAQSQQGVGQGSWWFPNYSDFLDKVNLAPANEIFGERYTHAQVSWIINSLLNIIVGPIAACADEPDFGGCLEAALNGADAGAIIPLAMANDTLLHTKPISGVDYVAQKMERLGIVNEAYAQSVDESGFGFANSLQIIQKLWTVARDAAYSLVILMILILGFMIMFRAQLGARTAVTIQSALPRVIVGLLLITFSYAIAGFLVDLTFVAQGILAGILASSEDSGLVTGGTAVENFQQLNQVTETIWDLFLAYLFAIFSFLFNPGAAAGAGLFVFLTGGAGAIILAGISLIIVVFVAIVALITLLRIFWVMLRTYVVIILLVAVSPFMFLYGIIKDGINGTWFRLMVANLSVFFTTGLILLICNILIFTTMPNDTAQRVLTGIAALFNANINPYHISMELVDNDQAVLPGFTSIGSTAVIGTLVSFALFISLPKFVSSVRDFLQSGRGDFGLQASPNAATAGLAGGAAGYGISRATRSNREELENMAASAKRVGKSPFEMANAGEYRRRQSIQAISDWMKNKAR